MTLVPEPVVAQRRRAARSPLSASRLNWLRAGVLGANDGIVSVAAAMLGVVAATSDLHIIVVTAAAVLVAGAMSMATGEYVSVSSQRDAELVARDHALARGRQPQQVEPTNPVHAALASFLSFVAGGLVPAVVVLGPWGARRDLATFLAVVVALAATGALSSRVSGAPVARAVRRVVLGGCLAMAVTYGIGTVVGHAV